MIVRRREFKRKRSYKRRASRRHPLPRLFKNMYAGFRGMVFPISTPLLMHLKREGASETIQWGGNGMYWDVTIGRELHR